jgi:hypothetical protein
MKPMVDTLEDTSYPLLRHERQIALLENKHEEHTKDNHNDLVKDLLDRLNNFQSDVFTRIEQAHEQQNTYLHTLLDPVAKRLDDLEAEIFPDGKDGEKSDDSEEGEENDGETPPGEAVEMTTPDVQANPKPPENQRRSRRAKRKARMQAKAK